MPLLKLEACKECGEIWFTVLFVRSVPADIRKGRLQLLPASDESVAVVVCQSCGRQHKADEFRMAA